jgi:uncharacterized protein YndB with AHSA1/START domain
MANDDAIDRADDDAHEQTIRAPAGDVWGFIVDPGALSVWFGADAWLEPVSGSQVRFRFADGTERRGEVVDVVPGRRLTWRWRELHGAGLTLVIGRPSTVTVELRPVPGGTRVRITDVDEVTAEARS